MRTEDEYGNRYWMFVITPWDFYALQAALAARTPNLQLTSTHLETGQPVITVTNVGASTILAYVTSDFHGWKIHDPEAGPQLEVNTPQQLADVLTVTNCVATGWEAVWQDWLATNDVRFCYDPREAPPPQLRTGTGVGLS